MKFRDKVTGERRNDYRDTTNHRLSGLAFDRPAARSRLLPGSSDPRLPRSQSFVQGASERRTPLRFSHSLESAAQLRAGQLPRRLATLGRGHCSLVEIATRFQTLRAMTATIIFDESKERPASRRSEQRPIQCHRSNGSGLDSSRQGGAQRLRI